MTLPGLPAAPAKSILRPMSFREHPAAAVAPSTGSTGSTSSPQASSPQASSGQAPHPDLLSYYANASVKRGFLRRIFDDGALDYDHVERLLSFGKGSQYRRDALVRAGLGAGMRVLDVAVGTGLVAREEISLTGDPRLVFGLDPSPGMMRQAVDALKIAAVLGVGEQIPMASGQFDFLSMGYGLRHLADLDRAFSEFFRVLRPGGRLCVLEITAPENRIARAILRAHLRCIVPMLTRLTTGRASSQLLWQYYWDTIEACVRPEAVMNALTGAGFDRVRRHEVLGIFSEYTAIKPL
jgi:demethylmenaquinone methyltransferase/2-methoxy-6-polyprenyl-1,4-benzoquinol methylase